MVTINKEVLVEVMNSSFQTQFDQFCMLATDERELVKTVTNGVMVKFNIYYYIEKMFKLKEKKGIVIIGGSSYPINMFYNEIHNRKNLMWAFLHSITDEDGATTSRV